MAKIQPTKPGKTGRAAAEEMSSSEETSDASAGRKTRGIIENTNATTRKTRGITENTNATTRKTRGILENTNATTRKTRSVG